MLFTNLLYKSNCWGKKMKVLILGGTGVISRSIVTELLALKHEVTVFNRGTKNLELSGDIQVISGDRTDRTAFETEMQRHQFDAVIDMICFNAEDAKSTVRAFAGRAQHIIITSSIAAYKRPYLSCPVIEDAVELWDDPVFPYAFHKAEMERYLQSVIEQQQLPITIIRPSLTYGPGAANIGVLRQNYGIMDRIRKGKPLIMFGDGKTPWSWTFVSDLAKAYAAVVGRKASYGQSFHVASEERRIWDDLYLEFGRIVGVEPQIIHIPSELLFRAAPNLCGHLYYEKSYAGLFDNTKFRTIVPEFRAEITLSQGLKGIAEWFEAEAKWVDPEKDQLEDQLVQMYTDFSARLEGLYTK